MEPRYSFRNILNNMTSGRKVLLVCGIIIILLFMILLVLWANNSVDSGEVEVENIDEVGVGADNDNEVDTGVVNIDGIDTEVEISTGYNKDHVYTLNDYLPRSRYEYLEDGSGVKTFFAISENTARPNSIIVLIDGCDEEKNRADADAYLQSIPEDLGEYEIVYDVIACE